MPMHPRTGKRFAEQYGRAERERQALERAEREPERLDPEIEERKLLAVLAEFEPVTPPPETSPAEAPAEVVRRLEALERQQPFSRDPPPPPRGDLQQRRNRALDALQRLRNEKAAEAQAERNREHERRCGKQIKRLEGRISDLESEQQVALERHRAKLAELDTALSGYRDKLGELTRSLPPTESTEQRLARLELT